jgi:hypothetical protein
MNLRSNPYPRAITRVHGPALPSDVESATAATHSKKVSRDFSASVITTM